MRIPLEARYNYCYKKALTFLISNEINSFPIDIDKLIKENRWALKTYTQLSLEFKLSIDDLCKISSSIDGFTHFESKITDKGFKKKYYCIAINDTIQSNERIYFTKLHEIGHIVLGHFHDFHMQLLNKKELSKREYKVLENEANCFARNVLSPAFLVQALKLTSKDKISYVFGITLTASRTRMNLLKTDLFYMSQMKIKLSPSIFNNFLNQRQCQVCGHCFISNRFNYCPICGNTKYKWSRENMKYDDGYNLTNTGRAHICPVCENEEISAGTLHCKICSTFVINQCTNEGEYDGFGHEMTSGCGQLASGNARYCEACGSQTTFFRDGLLKDWKEVKEFMLSKQEVASPIQYVSYFPQWTEVLTELRDNGRVTLYANLIDSNAINIDERTVGIAFEKDSNFKKAICSKNENIKVIQDIIIKITGKQLNVTCITVEFHNTDDKLLMKKATDLSNTFKVPLSIIDE